VQRERSGDLADIAELAIDGRFFRHATAMAYVRERPIDAGSKRAERGASPDARSQPDRAAPFSQGAVSVRGAADVGI
jgi:hypothetical protein